MSLAALFTCYAGKIGAQLLPGKPPGGLHRIVDLFLSFSRNSGQGFTCSLPHYCSFGGKEIQTLTQSLANFHCQCFNLQGL